MAFSYKKLVQEAGPLAEGLMGKVSNPHDVLTEVLAWTGGQPFLTQKLCKLIPAGIEASGIKDLVQSRIIKNWEFQDEPEHLRTIRDRLLRNEQRAGQMLGLYQQILQQEGIPADDSPQQMELRLTGLVVKQQGKLEVYNRIYKEVFGQRWLNKELADLRPPFYREAITAWVASNRQDESRLLRGDELKNAQKWAERRNLSSEDNDFLNASRELRTRELEKVVGPTNLKFKHEEASSVVDLIYLCDKYPDIAADYLFNGYLEDWLYLRSQTDLANLSRNIVRSYEDERFIGLEMFVRGLCKHLKPDLYPKIFFEPNELNLGEIPIGFHKTFPLKIGNNGRGFAWGDVINPNLPGVSIPDQFDSSNETFDIQLDTLDVQAGEYQGCIFICPEGLEYTCRIPINYKVRKLNVSIDPRELDLGVVSHSGHSIATSLRITCESSKVRLKGTASTDMAQLAVTPPSFEDSSFELSLTLDTTPLEAGSYNAEIFLITNTGEFQVPVYFRKLLRWDIIAGLTTGIGVPTGLCMYYIRFILGNHLSVGLNDSWVLSYPPEVRGASFLRQIYPDNIFALPEVQLTCLIFGFVILSIAFLIFRLRFRHHFEELKEGLWLKLATFWRLSNQFIEKIKDGSTRNTRMQYNYQLYRTRNPIIVFIGWLIKLALFLFIFWGILGFTTNCLINIFTWLGASFIIIPDLIAYSLILIRINQPVVGWLVLGIFTGGALGLIQALKSIKQYSYLSKIYKIGIVIPLILLLTGSLAAKFNPPTELLAKIVLEDKFNPPSEKWNKAPSATWKFGGLFHQEPKDTKINHFSFSIWGDTHQTLEDVDFSVNARKDKGSNDVPFGIIARYRKVSSSGHNFYYLLINGNGQFAMGKYPESGNGKQNIGWQKSTALKQGNNTLNRLRIVCYKQKLIGWINDQRVGIVEDGSYTSGKIGVISARGNGDPVAVHFNNVIVKTKS